LNHYVIHLKLILHCMSSNWNLNENWGKKRFLKKITRLAEKNIFTY